MPHGIPSSVVQTSRRPAHPRSELLERFVAEHGGALMRVARSHASNAADADDAYQRTLEVMLTKAPETADGDRLMAWAITVARNEALMQHRRRKKIAHDSFEEISKTWVDVPGGPDEGLVERERLGHGREALQRLTSDQMRLLLLRADGFSYDEICARTGFSHAKVNRLLCEGRKAFRDRVERIDSGAECRRLEGVLSMIADGEARDEARRDAELHLAGCVSCQVTLREFAAAPSRASELLPIGALAGGASGDWVARAGEQLQSWGANLQERLFGSATSAHQGAEMTFAKKAALATAVTAAVVAGGAGVQLAVDQGTPAVRGDGVKFIGDVPLPSGQTGTVDAPTGSAGASTAAGEPRELQQSDVVSPDSTPAIERVIEPPAGPDAELAPSEGDTIPSEADTGGGEGPAVDGLQP